MDTHKTYRNNGAIGALLDEYQKSLAELKDVLSDVSEKELVEIVDHETSDKDCKSIQTILSHVVESGYTYVIEIRKWLGEDIQYMSKELLFTIDEYNSALDKMFAYNLSLFEDYPTLQLEEYKMENKMTVRWGQKYDAEQLIEHAIVHILRHRRQIERFKLKMNHQS